jgi:hypothetical protein
MQNAPDELRTLLLLFVTIVDSGAGAELQPENLEVSVMSTAGMVTMFLGVFIICTRAPLVLIPATALRWLGEAIKTERRTRVYGAIAALIAVPMIWAGTTENTELASVLFIFGVFFLVVSVSGLVLFPNVYMSLANSFIPEDLSGNLIGWRIFGIASVLIGCAIFMIGMRGL